MIQWPIAAICVDDNAAAVSSRGGKCPAAALRAVRPRAAIREGQVPGQQHLPDSGRMIAAFPQHDRVLIIEQDGRDSETVRQMRDSASLAVPGGRKKWLPSTRCHLQTIVPRQSKCNAPKTQLKAVQTRRLLRRPR